MALLEWPPRAPSRPDLGLAPDANGRPWAAWSAEPPTGELLKSWTGFLYLVLHAYGRDGVAREHRLRKCEVIAAEQQCDLAAAELILREEEEAAIDARWRAERERVEARRIEREAKAAAKAAWLQAEQEKVRASAAIQDKLDDAFLKAGSRNRWIYQQRLLGRTLKDIAAELGISGPRVREIALKQQNLEFERRGRLYERAQLSRIIDMGGPRGMWLTYFLPTDPREEP